VVLWASAFVAIRSAGKHFAPGALALGRLLVTSLASAWSGGFTGAAARLPFAGQLLSRLGAPYNPRGHNLRRSRPSRHGDQRARRMTTGTVDLVREDY
jgi:hypothetical protein